MGEGKPGGFQTGRFSTFFGKGLDCVADPGFRDYSSLVLLAINRPRKRERTNRENPGTNREGPNKDNKNQRFRKGLTDRGGWRSHITKTHAFFCTLFLCPLMSRSTQLSPANPFSKPLKKGRTSPNRETPLETNPRVFSAGTERVSRKGVSMIRAISKFLLETTVEKALKLGKFALVMDAPFCGTYFGPAL